MLDKIPEITERLLAPIPRLEDVRTIVRQASTTAPNDPKSMLDARILRVALDFADLEALTGAAASAHDALRLHPQNYDPQVLGALAQLLHVTNVIVELPLSELREGMVVSADVRTKAGLLLVSRGHEVTIGLLGRLENFASSLESKMVLVIARGP